jgi:hypothetical protein
MTRAIAVLLLACTPAAAQFAPSIVTNKSPRIAPGTFVALERRYNAQLSNLFDVNDPFDLIGLARGVQVEGFGVVFTAEVSLIRTPTLNPFQQSIPKDVPEKVRKRKTERLPFLVAIMKDMMKSAAMTFVQIPEDQQVLLAVRFLYQPWEDRTGMPSQILMRASRKAILAGDIKMEEQ